MNMNDNYLLPISTSGTAGDMIMYYFHTTKRYDVGACSHRLDTICYSAFDINEIH